MLLRVSGAFENGVAEGQVEEALQPISALRLVVHSDSDVWAVLSEVCPSRFNVFNQFVAVNYTDQTTCTY